VKFKVNVSNCGNVALTGIVVSDTDFTFAGVAGSLAVGAWDESNVYILDDALAGQQWDNASVVGTPPVGPVVTDYDLAYYFGSQSCINIEKYVSVDNGVTWLDADTATGPYADEGSTVKFKVNISNCGNINLTGITVIDTDFTFTDIATSLVVGAWDESAVYSTTALVDQQWDNASVTCSQGVSDWDLAYYFGEAQGGCTYTPGYWKTHSSYGPAAHTDPTWMELPNMDGDGNLHEGPDELFYGNNYGLTWLTVMSFSSKDAKALGLKWTDVQKYQHLAFHYVAAVLNGLMNENPLPQEIDDAIANATSILAAHPNMIIPLADYLEVTMLTAQLAEFNEGMFNSNWPHCGD